MFLARSTMARKASDAAIATAKADPMDMAAKRRRDLRLVDPAYTTMRLWYESQAPSRAIRMHPYL